MQYFELEPKDNTFSNLVVDLTHRCNMECANCYIPNRIIPDLDVAKLYALLEQLPFRTYIRLIGAEPTMREDLADIISNVKRRGHNVSLTTNGLKLGHKEYVRELKDAGLRLVLISMNGAADDNIYKIIDNGKYANLKVRALRNCMLENMIINTGTIIAKGINEFIFTEQFELFKELMNETKYKPKVKPVLRFKSVGAVGRHMKDSCYTFNELNEMLYYYIEGITKVDISTHNQATVNNFYELDNIYVRLVDWSTNDISGTLNEFDNPNRGRITQNFKIAPFFEHVILNEYEY